MASITITKEILFSDDIPIDEQLIATGEQSGFEPDLDAQFIDFFTEIKGKLWSELSKEQKRTAIDLQVKMIIAFGGPLFDYIITGDIFG
jgi:hypothetical protein